MEVKTLRILGKKGRITIPFPIRRQMDVHQGDILSFSFDDEDNLLIHREELCNNCLFHNNDIGGGTGPLFEILDSLSPAEQYTLLAYLSEKWGTDSMIRKE